MPSLRSRSRRNNRSRSRSRRSRRSRRSQRGGNGWSAQQSLNQGKEFASFHTNQHGGAQVPLGGAPVDHDSLLPGEMRNSAGLAQADGHFRAVGGMSDAAAPPPAAPAQKGGRRSRNRSNRSRNRNSRNRSRNRNSRNRSRNRNRKSRNRRNRQSGGSHGGFNGAPVSNSFNLLESGQYSKAGTADFSNPLLLK